MPTTRPQWPYTHKAWKALKSGNKTSAFPDTGTGKALDKIEALYKKIDWDSFEYLSLRTTDDQKYFYNPHAVYINPFLRAVEAASKTIYAAKAMPVAGMKFAAGMEDQAKEFALKSPYFSNILKERTLLGKRAENKKIIDDTCEKLSAFSVEAAIKSSVACEILLEHAEKEKVEENVLFLKACYTGTAPDKIYELFLTENAKWEINVYGAPREALARKYQAETLKLADFAAAITHITGLLGGANAHWPTKAVAAWKAEQYKKYKIPA